MWKAFLGLAVVFFFICECAHADHNHRVGLVCSKNRYSGLWNIYRLSDNNFAAGGYASQEQCNQVVRSRRGNLLCSPSRYNRQNFYLKDIITGKGVSYLFTGLEGCLRSLERSRREIACLPARYDSNKFYLKDFASNESFGSLFNDQSSCLKTLDTMKKQKLCMKARYSDRFYLFDVPSKQGLGNIFENQNDCIRSLQAARRDKICMKQRYGDRFFIFNMQDNSYVFSRSSFPNQATCLSSMQTARKNWICLPGYNSGAVIKDMSSGDNVSNWYSTLENCQNNLGLMKRKQICMPSRWGSNSYIVVDLEKKKSQGRYNYFSDEGQCQLSVQSIVSGKICLPLSHNSHHFYLHDINGQEHLPGYFESQAECLQSVGPLLAEERRHCRERRRRHGTGPSGVVDHFDDVVRYVDFQ